MWTKQEGRSPQPSSSLRMAVAVPGIAVYLGATHSDSRRSESLLGDVIKYQPPPTFVIILIQDRLNVLKCIRLYHTF